MPSLLTTIRVDRDVGLPLGAQIEARLLAAISTEELRPGDRLPSVRDMASAADVNVNTIRAVYDRLARNGYLASRQGSGTFVADAIPTDVRASRTAEFAATIESSARDAGVEVAEVIARLYGSSAPAPRVAAPDEGALRRYLYAEIECLETEVSRHPQPLLEEEPAPTIPQGRLLTTDELIAVKSQLLERLRSHDEVRAAQLTRVYLMREMRAAEETRGADLDRPSSAPARPTPRPRPALGFVGGA